jgi:nucleotide-binding universal stress UspA family protein
MKKRFIVLTDLSEHSANLLEYAWDWARRVDAEIALVHQVMVFVPSFADVESGAEITRQAILEAVHQMEALCEPVFPDEARVSMHVSEIPLRQTLSRLLGEPFSHLIVTGLKGTSLLKKMFIGSTTVQILETTSDIVAAIPKDITSYTPEKIFVAVSEKHPFNAAVFNNLLEWMGPEAGPLTFFYLGKSGEDNSMIEKQLRDLAKLFSAEMALYEGGNAFADIKKVINNREKELLVVQKGSRLLTDRLFRKFLINELVYEGETPLIVLP